MKLVSLVASESLAFEAEAGKVLKVERHQFRGVKGAQTNLQNFEKECNRKSLPNYQETNRPSNFFVQQYLLAHFY